MDGERLSVAITPKQEPPGWGDAATREFMLEEYRAYRTTLMENEKRGDSRLNFFLTLTTAILGALALRQRSVFTDSGGIDPVVYLLLIAALLFGAATLGRMVDRNLTTDRMLRALGRIRSYFCATHPVDEYLTWKPGSPEPRQLLPLLDPRKGGVVEMVVQLNSGLTGAILALAGMQVGALAADGGMLSTRAWGGVAGGISGFLLAWFTQVAWVNRRYREDQRMAGNA